MQRYFILVDIARILLMTLNTVLLHASPMT